MLMGTNTVSNTDTTSKYASVLGTTAKETPLCFRRKPDRFLKLFVAQLNNQDPMNPMDNAQMTTQMAQINTVSGIEKLNDTVKSLTTQFSSMQLMQSATMVGREVLSAGNTVTINNKVGKGALGPCRFRRQSQRANFDPGRPVTGDGRDGCAQTAGQHSFQWDASSYSASTPPVFKVTATQGGKSSESYHPDARHGAIGRNQLHWRIERDPQQWQKFGLRRHQGGSLILRLTKRTHHELSNRSLRTEYIAPKPRCHWQQHRQCQYGWIQGIAQRVLRVGCVLTWRLWRRRRRGAGCFNSNGRPNVHAGQHQHHRQCTGCRHQRRWVFPGHQARRIHRIHPRRAIQSVARRLHHDQRRRQS